MTTTTLGARWLGSPNYARARDGHSMAEPPAYVVMHTMVATWESANGRFQNANEQASATYGVLLDGGIVQWVDEDDAAYANGTYDRNPGSNLDSISIEHEDAGDYNGPRTPALYRTSALLVRDICSRYGIPVDRGHVLLHREVSLAPTACPDSLDVDRIVRMAAGLEPLPGDPAPTTRKEDDMGLYIRNQDNGQIAVVDAAGVRFNPAEWEAREEYAAAAGVPAWVNLPTAAFQAAIKGTPVIPAHPPTA